MNNEEIIRTAREAGALPISYNETRHQTEYSMFGDQLERFAVLAFEAGAAHEREACAKVCEDIIKRGQVTEYQHRYNYAYEDCAAAIRAIGENK